MIIISIFILDSMECLLNQYHSFYHLYSKSKTCKISAICILNVIAANCCISVFKLLCWINICTQHSSVTCKYSSLVHFISIQYIFIVYYNEQQARVSLNCKLYGFFYTKFDQTSGVFCTQQLFSSMWLPLFKLL